MCLNLNGENRTAIFLPHFVLNWQFCCLFFDFSMGFELRTSVARSELFTKLSDVYLGTKTATVRVPPGYGNSHSESSIQQFAVKNSP